MTREEANKELIEMYKYINGNIEIRRKQYEALNMAIEALKQPEIVRCKDCEFKEGSCCTYSAVYLWADGFCHRGRRKEEVPTVEPRQKNCKWYLRDTAIYGGLPYLCIVCGREAKEAYDFCPNCGTKMWEEEK